MSYEFDKNSNGTTIVLLGSFMDGGNGGKGAEGFHNAHLLNGSACIQKKRNVNKPARVIFHGPRLLIGCCLNLLADSPEIAK